MLKRLYILEGQIAKHCPDLMVWAEWMDNHALRRVALDAVGECEISTVFLGIDHNFLQRDGDPLLFETMIFLPDSVEERVLRYFTWGEAKAGHDALVCQLHQEHAESKALSADLIRSIAESIKSSISQAGEALSHHQQFSRPGKL